MSILKNSRLLLLFVAVGVGLLAPQSASASLALPSVPGGTFGVVCPYVRSLQVDPIVSPGIFPSAHLHDFFGNRTVDQNSTPNSIRGQATTCALTKDTAGYWAPAAYRSDTGAQVIPVQLDAYYRGIVGVNVEALPAGLEMVAGNSHATGEPANKLTIGFDCGNTANTSSPTMTHPYDCTNPAYGVVNSQGVRELVHFPYCWDGTGLQPADVVQPGNYARGFTDDCPTGFSHILPQVEEHIMFGSWSPTTGSLGFQRGDLLTLSSGAFYTLHADYMQAWDQPTLVKLITDCLDAHKNCGLVMDGKPLP